MNEQVQIEHVIIGGGILGILTALALKKKFPDQEVIILEKNEYLGDETTGRNSGVLHAGLYYPTNSLKHRHCIAGNRLWRKLADLYKLTIHETGKFIICAHKDELEGFNQLRQQIEKNEVPGIRAITEEEKKLLQSQVHFYDALYSESSAIIDTAQAVKKLANQFENLGGIILKSNKVFSIIKNDNGFHIQSSRENIQAKQLINCAGLGAIKLRKKLGLLEFEDHFVKGHYLKISPDPKYKHLLYPIPPKGLKGLGVHSTLDISGLNRFGPDTENINYIDYDINDAVIDKMLPQIQRLFKNIKRENLSIDYCGIRPKIKRHGDLYADFYLGTPKEHQIKGYFEFLGIESPGLTAAPSLALEIVKKIVKD